MTSKRKTKQLRWLVTMMMLAMTMVMPISTWAQQEMYTVYEYGTLTFMYGDKQSEESGNVYDVPTDPKDPGWLAKYNNSITTVVFDESFKAARPTSCYKWFYNCSILTSIKNIENLNTEEVTDMSDMFNGCSRLTSLDVSKFNTAEVENMSGMFSGCWGLSSLDLTSFNTAKVTNMNGMFGGCDNLISLDLSSFNTAKVTNMNGMFWGCKKLTSLDLSSFNTAEVTDMGNMFGGCSGLTSLDLSSFNTANVENMSYMFNGCSGLTKIYVSDNYETGNVSSSDKMFSGCSQLAGNVSFDSKKIDHTMANCTSGYFTKSNLTPYVKWDANTKVLTFKWRTI